MKIKNTLSKFKTFTIFSLVFSIIMFLWFSNIPGMQGTFNWHTTFKTIYIIQTLLLILNIIFLILNFPLENKWIKNTLRVLSIINIIHWAAFFFSLKILTSIPVENSGLKLLKQNELFAPVRKSTDKVPLAHIAFSSDPHWGSGKSNTEARTNILKAVDSNDFDAFFILGDITEMGMLAGDYKLAITDLKKYLQNTKFMPIPGNHDAILNGLELYNSVFPQKGKQYFRMDSGQIHFIFINMLWDSTELTHKQLKWLEKQLQSIPQEDTVILLSHCYILSSGYYDSSAKKNWGDLPDVMEKLCPLIEKYNVDLHMSGHEHFFEYLEKEDHSYLVLGTMGGILDENLIYNSPYSKWINNTSYGYVDMRIFDSYLEFDLISDKGKILFSKTIQTK